MTDSDTGVLLAEPEKHDTPTKPEPIALRSRHDHSIVATTLELRKEDLKKLAKKTHDEGYPREARAITNDALAIEHHILPEFRAQRELPLVTYEALATMVASALRTFVFNAFDGLGDPKVTVTYDGVKFRRDKLMEALTQRVTLYAQEVAAEAYRQGEAAREQTPEAIAARGIATLAAHEA